MFEIPEGTICRNCGERPATILRGIPTHAAFRSCWCERCDLEDAIAKTEEQMAKLPGWEDRLMKLIEEENK